MKGTAILKLNTEVKENADEVRALLTDAKNKNKSIQNIVNDVQHISSSNKILEGRIVLNGECFAPSNFSLCTNGKDAASWFWSSPVCPPGYKLTGEGTTTALVKVQC